MSDTVLSVKNLGKKYRLGRKESYKTLSETIGKKFDGIKKKKRPGVDTGSLESSGSDTFWALKDVTFDVKKGEVVGIIGRNGAGKSTLLKILSRITSPTEGEAYVRGRVGSLLEVGTGFHPELTGRENIYLSGSLLGMTRSEIDQKFEEIVRFSEIEKFLDTPVKRYSSGMYVRLAFAVAAHLEPEILIIDEVLAVGDAQFQKKCLGKMGDVAKQGRTILFVSHNMNAIEQLCTSCILLQDGRIKQYSQDVREVVRNYLFNPDEAEMRSEWINTNNTFDNPWFQPTKFYLSDRKGGIVASFIKNDDNITVNIEGIVRQIDPALTIGYAVFTQEGQMLYWSYQTDVPVEENSPLKLGINILQSTFPKRLLNEGTYRIEFIGGLHYREWLFEPGVNAPSISLTIQGGLSDSPFWMAKRPGILAPVIEWKVVSLID